MEDFEQKARSFLSRLLANPALQGYNALQREDQIIQFIQLNLHQLLPTLSSPQFFHGYSQRQIFNLLLQTLYSMTDDVLNPGLDYMVSTKLEYGFLEHLSARRVNVSAFKDQLQNFLRELMKGADARRAMTGCFAALEMGYPARYMEEFFRHKSYVHFELTKVQRLKMSVEEITQMVNLTLLLRSGIYLAQGEGTEGIAEQKAGLFNPQYLQKMKKILTEKLNHAPEELLDSALDSSLSFETSPKMEATSRIAALLDHRCKGLKKDQVRVKGAESSDKSWFNVARRNFKFFGFDIKVLDEFYKIASENGW